MERSIQEVRKRDGSLERFDSERIARAIRKAQAALSRPDDDLAQEIADQLVGRLVATACKEPPSVEEIQDVVERLLVEKNQHDLAKAYILYRNARSSLRHAKESLGVTDDLKLPLNAIRILQRRYLRKDEEGRVVETPSEMFSRVAEAMADVDNKYEGKRAATESRERFFDMLSRLDFLPNSPTLMNAGTELGQLSACFVIPVEDSMESIFDSLKAMALIHQSGGGTGFGFSKLRPRADMVRSTGGIASGPVSFVQIFDKAT